MKSRKVKAVAKSKAFMSKKQKKGNIPLDDFSESDADVDERDLLYNERDHEDDELSTDDDLIRHKDDSSEEEEVLPITDDEKEDSDEDEEKDLPKRDYWGKKKSAYYDADFVDEDRGKTYREQDAEKAALEAEEALAIQKSVYSFVKTDNLNSAEVYFKSAEEELSKEEPEDNLNKEENIKILKKSSPELFVYIDELKEKLTELKEKYSLLYTAVQDKKIPDEKLSSYINNYYIILMHYCMNLSFYMAIRSKGPVNSSHPIIKRINSFKNMLDQLNDMKIVPSKTLDYILNKLKNNEEVTLIKKPAVGEELPDQDSIRKKFLEISKMSTLKEKKNKKKSKQIENGKTVLSEASDSEDERMEIEDAIDDVEANIPEEETAIDGKRKITYQIAKNKGLTVKRKKELRNPRVHNRMKFRKAKIRRKGQVREVIRETKRYEGEPTGISAHVVRSIKLK